MPHKDKVVSTAYKLQWRNKRRARWFEENGPCVICGDSYRLELDHINPATKVSHYIWNWPDKKRLEELAKCQVLCRKCHINKSNKEKLIGEQQPQSRLSEKQVLEIRATYRKDIYGLGMKRLAKQYNVSASTIQDIVKRRTWQHI